jgi:hypothetical protein
MPRITLVRICLPLALLLAAFPPPRLEAQRDRVQASSPIRRRCTPARLPEELPSADALVDSAVLVAEAARLGGTARGFVVASLRHDVQGTQVRRRVIERELPPELADSLEALLYAVRRVTPAAPVEWGVRLRIELNQGVRLRVTRQQECPAVPSERDLISSPSGFDVRAATAEQAGTALATDPSVVWVRLQVDERGSVVAASVTRGYRRGAIDDRVLRYVRTLTFHPALQDGYPVPAEVELPIPLSLVP